MPITKTKLKKDGLQQYRVRVNYTDTFGKYVQKERTAYGLNEARELEQELMQYAKTPTRSMTVQNLYEEYIKEKAQEVRPTTLKQITDKFKNHILPYVADVKIDKLNVMVLRDWKAIINEKKLAISTKQKCFTEFKALLNYAIKYGYLTSNPLAIVGNFKQANFIVAEQRMRVYTSEQFFSYIGFAKQTATTYKDWCFYVFFNIAFYTGLRKGEIHALKWSDLNGDFLHVRRIISQKLKGGDIETPPKNQASYRKLQMPQQLIMILKEHKERQQQLPDFSNDFRVCGGANCLRDTSIDKKNRAYAIGANLPRITIHEFRHTHASLLIAQKINILEISHRLGHATPTITLDVYGHLFPNEEQEVIAFLDSLDKLTNHK